MNTQHIFNRFYHPPSRHVRAPLMIKETKIIPQKGKPFSKLRNSNRLKLKMPT
ncbi:hypothetical protein OIU77_007742 [Salix suchowensis]|uniref:Uncharacterized protein n=1 Tax=Salix suchowensis TaxID=1278906 RepID=A0ABQ9AIH4_9ROSI|nr:hypothetical protein OIU77_007742 [Salix suchowensis]